MRTRAERNRAFERVDIYPVTSEAFSAGRSNREVLEAIIQGGSQIVQFREKNRGPGELREEARWFRRVTRGAGILLIINDHLDIALEVEADGVHLGQSDMPLIEARRRGPELLIGVSCHNIDQALRAKKEGADYVNLGPIFPTKTKEQHSAPVGVELIEKGVSDLSIPFTVMGGIHRRNIDEVLRAGARKVAVVTAITQAKDMVYALRSLRLAMAEFRAKSSDP